MSGGGSPTGFDMVVLGEVLVEVAADRPIRHGVPATIGVSGDALNVAAAAAAAGARTGLAAVLTDDELGRSIAARIDELGISTALLRFRSGQQGVYLVHSDPLGEREFSYARRGSIGSTLSRSDVDPRVLSAAGAVAASGIACGISETSRDLVYKAARLSDHFVYDPNHRPRITSATQAAADLKALADGAWLLTPSSPGETARLMGEADPAAAAEHLRSWGARQVAVTCGAEGVQLNGPEGTSWVDAIPAPAVVDQTGAGDAFVGTLSARLVLGDSLQEAALLAAAAASLVVGGRGGTGFIPTLSETRRHAGHQVSALSGENP